MDTTPVTNEPEKSSKYKDAAVDFLGGVVGGIVTVYVGQPLDTVKVKLQSFPSLYKNAADCFVKTFREEGLAKGLYAGTAPSLIANVSENAILFLAYGQCQKAMAYVLGKREVSSLTPFENSLAGGCSGFFSALALCPTELVKCKLQAQEQVLKTSGNSENIKKMGPFSLTRHILSTEGIPGLFRGLVATICRDMPSYVFFFGGYETCRYLFTPPGGSKDDIGILPTMFSGAMGGVALWCAVFPMDVIKTRSQVLVSMQEKNLNAFQIFNVIRREEGIRALYRGLGPTLLRTMPATAMLFLSYETVKKFFGTANR